MILIDGVKKDMFKGDLPDKNVVFQLTDKWSTWIIKNDIRTRSFPASFTIEPFYAWTDTVNGTQHQVRYTKSTAKNDKGVEIFSVQELEFTNGKLVVKPTETDLLWFLRNHPMNDTAEQYSSPKGAKQKDSSIISFSEININKQNKEAWDKEEALLDAGVYIRALRNKVLREHYEGFGRAYDDETEVTMKNYLMAEARKNPIAFLEKCKSGSLSVKALVSRAVDRNVIKLDGKMWKWVSANGVVGNGIVKVPTGKDETEYLVEWLAGVDGTATREEIETELEKVKASAKADA